MRSVSAALRAAIDSGERIIDGTFTVDWDNDGVVQDIDNLSRKVSSLSATQSLESSLPQQVQLVPGVSVGELTAQLSQGNTNRYAIPVTYRGLTTSSSVFIGAGDTWTIAKPAGAKTGDVILVAVFTSLQGIGSIMSMWQPIAGGNVAWSVMSVRGDGGVGGRLEGILLYRRVVDTEPSSYTLKLPANATTTAHLSAAVNIGEQNIMGVTSFTQKGEDNVSTATGITLPQVKVDVPNSAIISFFGAASYAVSGLAFTPLDANDTEQTEVTVTPTAPRPSIRAAVTTQMNAQQGLYQKGVIFTGSAGSSAIATLGFSVVVAPIIAGDEAQHAAWTFSELNPNSPYAGKTRIGRRVKWLLNFVTANGGFESVPMFTGRTTAPSASNRQVTIKALDNRETMRNTGQGLNIAAVYPVSKDITSGTSKPTMPGLEATWVVSRLFFLAFYRVRQQVMGVFTYDTQTPLRSGLGYFPSPLPSLYTGVWATFHGSAHDMTPSSGVFQLQYAYTEGAFGGGRRRIAYEVGPFVAATKNEATGISTYVSWTSGTYVPWRTSNGQIIGRVQCWVRRNQVGLSYAKIEFPDNNGTLWSAWVEVLTTGVVQFRVEKPSVSRTIVGPTIAADGTWHFLGVHFDSVAGTVVFRVDSTNTTVAMATWTDAVISAMTQTTNIKLSDGMQIAEFITTGGHSSTGSTTGIATTDKWANENFVPTAFVDKSENILDVMPAIDPNQDIFGVVSDIANAEFAAFFFDADGYPHFRNSRSDASPTGQTVQKTVTARHDIRGIAYESGVLQIRNIVSVGYAPFTAVINGQIFSISGIVGILANTSQTYTVTTQGPVISTNAPTFSAYSQADGTGIVLTGNITVTVSTITANRIDIMIKNTSGSTAYLVNNAGQANFVLTGTFFSPLNNTLAPITYADADSVRKYDEQPLSVDSSSAWIQREDTAAMLALKLLSDLCEAHPVVTNLEIKGDPTLEFGDLVTVQDVNGIGVNGRYRITTKNPNFTPGDGFTQSLVVRSAPTIAFWDTNFWDDGTVWG